MILVSKFAQRGWYTSNPLVLREWMGSEMGSPKVHLSSISGVIMPHAGYSYSGSVALKVMRQLIGRRYRRIVIVGPSHFASLTDQVVIPDATGIETPLGVAPLDTAVLAMLREQSWGVCRPEIDDQEHSVQIEIPFFQAYFPEVPLVPLVVGQFSKTGFDQVVKRLKTILGPDTLLVASSDFTHYGQTFRYVPFQDQLPDRIQALDFEVIEALESGDRELVWRRFSEKSRTICGEVPIKLMVELLPEVKGLCLDYRMSGQQTGDWASTVSYAGMVFGASEGG